MGLILVVDADDATRGAACQALATAAHVVHGVRHASDGPRVLDRRKPDLILLAGDAQAPEAGAAPRADAPLLVRVWSRELAGISGDGALLAGADAWFAAPAGDGELVARIDSLLLQWRLAGAARQALRNRQLALSKERNARLPFAGVQGAYLAH